MFISWRHVKFLVNKFQTDEEFTRVYLLGPAKKTGRITIMGPDERGLLNNFIALDTVKILQIMKRDFIEFYHGNIEDHPYSMTTFKREIHKARLSFKQIEDHLLYCSCSLCSWLCFMANIRRYIKKISFIYLTSYCELRSVIFFITIILYTLSEEHFTSFLDERVRLMLAPGAVGVFDNAAIHHSLGSRLMLEDVFTNLYYFLPVYSQSI